VRSRGFDEDAHGLGPVGVLPEPCPGVISVR
jgi:hypothetical protein